MTADSNLDIARASRATILAAKRDDWETPHDLFDRLWDEAGGFDCDPACAPGQHTTTRVLEAGGLVCYAPGAPVSGDEVAQMRGGRVSIDGLTSYWVGKVFLNPPYGRGLGLWVEKAITELQQGHCESVTALLPAYTGTRWWQDRVVRSLHRLPGQSLVADFDARLASVRFLKGRLRFVGAEGHARMANVVVVWRRV